jgi:nucleoside-diphosphate-sugar epimerase
MPTKVLFIGGTGKISSACADLAVKQGIDLYLLNRGQSGCEPVDGATVLLADIRDPDSVRAAIGNRRFDCIVDFIAFTPEQVQTDIDLFRGRTSQYIFISSASVYRKPPGLMPVVESSFAANKHWAYSRNKIACEDLLINAFRESDFPVTIVRPSHTYDKRSFPWFGGWTVIDRMLKGQKLLVHGDGTSLWTLTHHEDFAKGLNGLLGNSNAVGETFHITSDEYLSWNSIHNIFGNILGIRPNLFHAPTDLFVHFKPSWEGDLLGDKSGSMLFDNSKIKRYVPGYAATIPYYRGANEIIDYFHEDPSRQIVDLEMNALFDKIIEAQHRAYKQPATCVPK